MLTDLGPIRGLLALALLVIACTPASDTQSVAATPTTTASEPAPPGLEPSEPFATTTIALTDGGDTIPMDVYVADSPALRSRGLMGREDLPAGTGMLFTYPTDSSGKYWMRDTLIPLSIAFFDAEGAVIDFFDMEPCTTPTCPRHGPDASYRYALEVPQGWFDEAGVDQSWRLDIDSL